MVAWQDHHRKLGRRDDIGRTIEQILRQTMAIERVAGQDRDIGACGMRRAQHAGKTGGPVAAVQACGVIMVHMQVGTVRHNEVAERR